MKRLAFAVACVLSIAFVPSGAHAERPSGRPGPDVLYEPLASAPQLRNSGDWHAQPLMVSGADAYERGEYLYQDYVYDDYGANTTNVPLLPPDPVPHAADVAFGGQTGDVVYPTDEKTYANDAADLLEFRARPVPGGTEYRITLNTMIAPDAAGVVVLTTDGSCPAPGPGAGEDLGYGLGKLGINCVMHKLVTWGTGAEFDGAPVASSADVETNQIDVVVPVWYGHAVVRHYTGVGLFDVATKSFKQILDDPTATMPGGAHTESVGDPVNGGQLASAAAPPPPLFNVGFRFDEPMLGAELYDPNPDAFAPGSRTTGIGNWREHAQATALAARDISNFHADVDFALLTDRVDESHVPTHGYISRLYASHADLGEGAVASRPMLRGKIEPYSIYVPKSYSGRPAPFSLLLHSLSCSYNQYGVFAPHLYDQIGDERGAILLAPEGRGPDGWWHDAAELDAFEAWADAARHYAIDWSRVTVTGYSMGGYGTFKMASQYPDLFARGFAVVGPVDEAIQGGPSGGALADDQSNLEIADNLRNVPLLMWEGTNDELVPLAGTLQYEKRLADLGYRHTQVLWVGYDHFLASIVDRWDEGRDFLGQYPVDRDPEEVVYRAVPAMDNAEYGLVHDHAYWVSDIGVRAGARSGLVDARSDNTTVGKPVPFDTLGAGAIVQPLRGAYLAKGTDWRPSTQAARNAFTLTLTGVSAVTIDVDRAGFDPDTGTLTVHTDGPVDVTLTGHHDSRTLHFTAA
jgi:poly(3-hydroxybutyrate) depolymerase